MLLPAFYTDGSYRSVKRREYNIFLVDELMPILACLPACLHFFNTKLSECLHAPRLVSL